MKINKISRTALIVPAVGVASLFAAGAAHAATSATGTVPGTANLTAGSLAIVANPAIVFNGTLNGSDLSLNDTTAADQVIQATDATGSNAGWNVSASSNGPFTETVGANTYTIPATALTLNGSTTSAAGTTGPAFACATGSTCTVAGNALVHYPVTVPDVSGVGSVLFEADKNTGEGIENASNLQWWLAVPSNQTAGTYNTTVTENISTGPHA